MAKPVNIQFERIKKAFSTDEIPSVSASTIKTYFKYLENNLTCPCLLTGIESIGFFRWEERFSFGYGSQDEYEQLKKKQGSFHDIYELTEFEAVADNWDIWVNVYRIPRRKRFTIPLSELQAADKASQDYQLLNDYTVWRINWQQ
jgi:hypothetical protein